MSDAFEFWGLPDEALICSFFHEIHGRDEEDTRSHFRKIFYDLHWQTNPVYLANDRERACRIETLTYIDETIFGHAKGACPFCLA
ncbi:hypothetical protein [Streptomyces netropsis]|uniref:Uncharacterized protein n=1 Tax=Streptomyces netropsis TaxID=55404 RepID=A0A7W7LGL6_STRNE|nr:hypothetical protein [Streptomyces netropsis]MBB4889855.1 hypothetical protein [Streptomyces netropsis]GGR41594.1 hypothetical protein GCM10010219_53600 [Streptomyces netropsis]